LCKGKEKILAADSHHIVRIKKTKDTTSVSFAFLVRATGLGSGRRRKAEGDFGFAPPFGHVRL
jgi:hypothetical protein